VIEPVPPNVPVILILSPTANDALEQVNCPEVPEIATPETVVELKEGYAVAVVPKNFKAEVPFATSPTVWDGAETPVVPALDIS
jgi:hypothetical protein